MTTMKLITGLGALVLLSLPAQAQSNSRKAPTTKPKPALNLQAPRITSSGTFIRCKVSGVAMSDEGLGFTCTTQDNKAYLVATTGGKMPGGISASMALVMEMAKQPSVYRRVRVKEARGGALRTCGLLRGARAKSDGLSCVQAMAIHMSSTDSAVSVGDANNDYPDIPTRPANPNGPTIPTGDARPD